MAYLAEHPKAMDTIEGMADWWLPRRDVQILRLVRVVADLTSKGVLEQIGNGETARYRLKGSERSTE